jgi:hypothetical protein
MINHTIIAQLTPCFEAVIFHNTMPSRAHERRVMQAWIRLGVSCKFITDAVGRKIVIRTTLFSLPRRNFLHYPVLTASNDGCTASYLLDYPRKASQPQDLPAFAGHMQVILPQ